jgi:hypothetical protein
MTVSTKRRGIGDFEGWNMIGVGVELRRHDVSSNNSGNRERYMDILRQRMEVFALFTELSFAFHFSLEPYSLQ